MRFRCRDENHTAGGPTREVELRDVRVGDVFLFTADFVKRAGGRDVAIREGEVAEVTEVRQEAVRAQVPATLRDAEPGTSRTGDVLVFLYPQDPVVLLVDSRDPRVVR